MAQTFVITNTTGTTSILIPPGKLNGFAGIERDTDLRFYGIGVQGWGEGVNENLYRLLESFAAPEKQAGDYNPVTGNNDYDPNTQDILPQDENDLGLNKGINKPTTGQTWFNTNTGSFYVFDQTLDPTFGWSRLKAGGIPTSSTEPTSPQLGDLWYDTNAAQVKTWNGSSWVSVANQYLPLDGSSAMTGTLDLGSNLISNVTDPASAQDAATKNYVDQEISIVTGGGSTAYVQKSGDTMTGDLVLSDTAQLILSDTNNTITFPNGDTINGTGDININAEISLLLNFNQGELALTRNNNTTYLRVSTDGKVNVQPSYETLGLTDNSLTNKKYVDDAVNTVTSTVNTLENNTIASPSSFTQRNLSTSWITVSATNWAIVHVSTVVFTDGVAAVQAIAEVDNNGNGLADMRLFVSRAFPHLGNGGSSVGSTFFFLPPGGQYRLDPISYSDPTGSNAATAYDYIV